MARGCHKPCRCLGDERSKGGRQDSSQIPNLLRDGFPAARRPAAHPQLPKRGPVGDAGATDVTSEGGVNPLSSEQQQGNALKGGQLFPCSLCTPKTLKKKNLKT